VEPSAPPARAETVFVRQYERLVRLAYLIAPAPPGRQSRLVRAHRLVHRALPWRARTPLTYPELVVRVLRRAAKPHRRALPVVVTWAWHTPLTGSRAHRELDEALATAEPSVRAGYALTMLENLPARDAVLLLQQAGWSDAVRQLAAASALRQRIHEAYGLSPDHQRHLLSEAPADPTLVQLRAPDPLMIRLWRGTRLGATALATALAAVLAGGLVFGIPGTPGDQERLQVRRVAANAWSKATELTLNTWPTRGARAGDDALLRTALTAWYDGRLESVHVNGGPPSEPPQVLYAGDVDGTTVAVLADATRIATYTEKGTERALRVEPAPRPDGYAASAIRLTPGRYLLAPWVAGAEAGDLDAEDWHRLEVTDGLTDAGPPPLESGSGCWQGPLLRLRSVEVSRDGPFTLADLGTAALAHLMYVPTRPSNDMTRPAELDAGAGLWRRLGCTVSGLRGTAAESVTAWQVWSGRLRAGAASDGKAHESTAQVACVRAALPGDGNRVWAVTQVGAEAPAVVAEATGTRLCSHLARHVVVGWWWQSPAGDWYHVAVGSRDVKGIEVTVDGATKRGSTVVASGPYPDKPGSPATVHATGRDGRSVPVLPTPPR
jgi:hypothetical protein